MTDYEVVKEKTTMGKKAGLRLIVALTVLLGFLIAHRDSEARPLEASIVIDTTTGVVLSSNNPDRVTYPASLTKMMTLYLLFEALRDGKIKMDSTIKFSRHSSSMPATNLSTDPGDTIRVETAILAIIVRSANDAASAVGETLAGTESAFAVKMTKKARALGMTNTTFRNASGLPDPGQKTTARDMAKLGIALFKDFPEYYRYFSRKSFTYHGVTYQGHNRLLGNFQGADGIKTGYIRASGFNLVSSAKRNGRRLVGVVLGGSSASSRDRKMAQILEVAFKTAPQKNTPIITASAAPSAPELEPELRPTQGQDPVASVLAMDSPEAQPKLRPQGSGNSSDDSGIVNVWDSNRGNFGIQVGAFSQQDSAKNAANNASQAITEILGEAHILIDEQRNKDGNVLYRARVIGLSKATAEKACQTLASKSTDCLVVKIDNSLAMGQ